MGVALVKIGRSWPVGCICEVIGLLCRRTVPRTFYVKENEILKRGPQLPQSDSAVTINCSGTVIALLSSSVRDAKWVCDGIRSPNLNDDSYGLTTI